MKGLKRELYKKLLRGTKALILPRAVDLIMAAVNNQT